MRHKSVDLDGVGALDLDRFELRILNDEVLALGHLVAAAFVLGGDRLAGLFIDELLAQAIAGGLVDLLVAARCCASPAARCCADAVEPAEPSPELRIPRAKRSWGHE